MLAAPLENHWLNIEEGRVESVSPKPACTQTQHLGSNSILLPAAVNAHAHLELSQLDAPLEVPSRLMSDWVASLMAFRRSGDYDAERGIRRAVCRPDFSESTIAVADIVPPTIKLSPENNVPFSVIPLRFIPAFVNNSRNGAQRNDGRLLSGGSLTFPLSKGERTASLKYLPFVELIAWQKEAVGKRNAAPPAFGLAPHAPHTICPALLENAIAQNVPLAMHLAETLEELQLLQHHTGPLLEMMQRADPDYAPASVLLGKRPRDYLQLLSAAPKAFIIHGNYLDDEELRFLASHRETMAAVYCPRSHAYFRHRAYPLKKMLDYGVRVLLGTDSLASTPNLSLVEDMQFAIKQHPTVAPEIIYRLGTLEGAAAFDLLSDGLGTIHPGSPARFAVVP